MPLVRFSWIVGIIIAPAVVAAQGWNDPAAVALVSRAVERRTVVQGDSGLRSWHVRAHGVVLFLAQMGGGGTGTPRLIKADELDVEVYWSAPGRSKQVIRGWRDRRYLPTDIHYHRDHLGMVTDGYGPRIRIGDGDEVKGVVHPLSVEGLTWYDFSLRDSAQVSAGGRTVILDAIDVRPRDPVAPGVIGTVYIDRTTAQLVRAKISFTPVSYLDRTIEDLTLVLDYALVDGTAWLPWRQTIEIRRNAGWLDLPYIGIIRGSWEFGEYDLDLAIPENTFAGRAIGGLGQAGDSAAPWPLPFDSVLVDAGPVVSEREVAEARIEVARAIEGRATSGLRPARVAATSLSDLVHFDRVQGVVVGAGMRVEGGQVKGGGSRVSLRPDVAIGFADGRVTGGAILTFHTLHPRPSTLSIYVERRIRDFSDFPVISRALNSLTAQESGDDHGDYVLIEGAGLRVEIPMTRDSRLATHFGWEDPGSLGISATPARGTFRPQADFGAPGYWSGGVTLGVGAEGESGLRVSYDGGSGDETWHRVTVAYQVDRALGGTLFRLRGYDGAATTGTPAWRTFALGGRGSLLGEGYRRWGGREVGWNSLEWRIPVPFPALSLGDFASTGHRAVLAPFVSGGWADGRTGGMPWAPTGGVKCSAGVALELFYQLVRIEAGASLRTGRMGVTFDVGRAWWGVL
jgi:hypothetical protein